MVSKLSNRTVYAFVTLGVLILLAIGINALVPGETPNPGHNIQTVGPPSSCASGQFLQFYNGNWVCADPSAVSSLWTLSGSNIYRSSGKVGIGASFPEGILGKLHIMGDIYSFNDGLSPKILVGDSLTTWEFGGMVWDSTDNVLKVGNVLGGNTINFNKTNPNMGINTTNPDSKLQVVGTVHATSLVADNLVQGQKGTFNELEVQNLVFETLLINQSQFSMKATNGDTCTVRMISSRVSGTSAPGNLSITCYAPLNVCGNAILELSNGEECDPPGSYSYVYNIIKDLSGEDDWDCSIGSWDYYFKYVKLTCDSSCQYTVASQTCWCETGCINPEPPHDYCRQSFNCLTSSPTAACSSGCWV